MRGADLLKEDGNGLTPIHSAARRGHTEMCRLLLSKDNGVVGVKASIVKFRNASPFHLACLSGNRELCKLFLENGADIMMKSVTHHTPLHFAAWQGHEEICELLIKTGNCSFCMCGRVPCFVFAFYTPLVKVKIFFVVVELLPDSDHLEEN